MHEKYILDNFLYEDGEIKRKDRKNGLGSYDKDGYVIMKVKGKQYKKHRIVWLLNFGSFPNGEIDHINRVRDDNRIENLRVVSRGENIQNTTKKRNAETGEYGIYIDKTRGLVKKYAFKFQNKTYRFKHLEEARNEREKLCKSCI